MQALLFPDIGLKTLGSNSTGAAFTWPKIVAGDDLRLKLRLTETISGEKVLSRRTLSALKLSIGRKKDDKKEKREKMTDIKKKKDDKKR